MRTSVKNLMALTSFLMMCGLLSPATAPAGDTVYITDIMTIGLRQGPDPKSSIIKALKSDAALEILEEQNNYLRVRTTAGDEGWIPKQHISSQTPKTQLIAALKSELAGLKERKQPLPDRGSNVAAEVQAIQAQYEQVKAELDRLKTQASSEQTATSNVSELGQELETLRTTNAKLTNDLEALRKEGSVFKRTDIIPWFLAGAGVFLAGFIVARLSNTKKKKSFY